MLVAAGLAASSSAVLAAKPPFTLSPTTVTFEAMLGSIDFEEVMVGTGPRWLVYQGPATAVLPFFDTQAGTCWQTYEAAGKRIPGKTTCTIQVGFNPSTVGTFEGQLVVYQCLKWHLEPTFGMIICDVTGDSQSVDVIGTAVQAP
jgi:hypothetical protein